MTKVRVVMTTVAVAIGAAILFAWMHSRAQAREREAAEAVAAGDLYGLAAIVLPRGYQGRGLASGDRELSIAEQLARQDEKDPLTFKFTRDPSNDWGGYAKDPELLNVVLLPPAMRERPDESLRRFSIERYYSPAAGTIPLDSPQWQADSDERYRWRVLSMNDHFGTDHPPRWAIAMLDPARGVRLDLFVWQKRMKQAQALTLLKGLLDGLQIRPALAAHFAQTGGVEARLARLREDNLAAMFAALAPYEVKTPAPGETTFGRGVAVWLDADRKAARVTRVLVSIPLPDGAMKANRDSYGRPKLELVLKENQYPGSTIDGLPALPMEMLYWNPGLERWQRSELQRPSADEEEPLLPFDQSIVDRLDQVRGARDAVHLVLGEHWFHPPALDDTRRIGPLLEEAKRWESELLAGRIVAGDVRESMLR